MQIQWSAIDRQASKSSFVMPTSRDGIISSLLFSAEISAEGLNDTPHCSIRRNTAITDIILMMFTANRANDAAMIFSLAFMHRVMRSPKQLSKNDCCPYRQSLSRFVQYPYYCYLQRLETSCWQATWEPLPQPLLMLRFGKGQNLI